MRFRDVKHDLTETKAEKTWVEEQKGRRQNDSQWTRNTYTFFLRLVGFLVIFFLKTGTGTSRCALFVDDNGGRGSHDPSFNGCDTRFWLVRFLLAVDCIFEVDGGRRGCCGDGEREFLDGERDCGCPRRLGGISGTREEVRPLIGEAGGDVFGGVS